MKSPIKIQDEIVDCSHEPPWRPAVHLIGYTCSECGQIPGLYGLTDADKTEWTLAHPGEDFPMRKRRIRKALTFEDTQWNEEERLGYVKNSIKCACDGLPPEYEFFPPNWTNVGG